MYRHFHARFIPKIFPLGYLMLRMGVEGNQMDFVATRLLELSCKLWKAIKYFR